jgi:glycosyltransferase involved in cell wall biosynthesis
MHLGLYIPVLDERPAGLGVYIHELCPRVAARFAEVTVLTQTPETVARLLPRARVLSCAVPPPLAGRVPRGPYRLLHLQLWGQAALEAHGVDVFFSPLHEALLWPRIPQVLVVHDLTPLAVPESAPRSIQLYDRWLLPIAARRSHRTIVVSDSTARDVEAYLGLPAAGIHRIYEGYDRAVFRPRSAEEKASVRERYGLPGSFLLYAGTLAANKNLGLVTGVVSALRDRGRAVRLALTGRHPPGRLAPLREALGAHADALHPVGYVPKDDLATLMSACDAFLYPSRHEGFGLAALEALACGAPVLASDQASLPEVVGDGGHLLPPDDVGRWIEAADALLEDPAAQAVLRERALRQAARFDWDDAAAETYAVLADAAAQATRTAEAP